jgi:DNA-binding GntR family transcriptional regulator
LPRLPGRRGGRNTSDPMQSKQGYAFSVVRRRILDGTYPPGYRLVIDTIARELDVSPMPVREALRRLEAEHWVVFRRNAGAEVAPVDSESWEEAIEALALVEGFVTAKAATHFASEDYAKMREICEELYADLQALNLISLSEHNELFHAVIAERCPNRILRREAEHAREQLNALRGTIYFPIRTRGRSSIDEHLELIEMLEQGQSTEEIEHFAREHRLCTIEARKRQLQNSR